MVPVLLMLGSIYARTAAARLEGEAARLEEEKARAEGEGERLEVRIAELSESEAVREAARKDLGMRDPGAEDLWAYEDGGSYYGEGVADGGGEKDEAFEIEKGAGE